MRPTFLVEAELSDDAEVPTGTFLLVDGETRADRGANARFEPQDLPDRLTLREALEAASQFGAAVASGARP